MFKIIIFLIIFSTISIIFVDGIRCYQGTSIVNGTLPQIFDCTGNAMSCQKTVVSGTVNRNCNFQQCTVLTPGNTTCSADAYGNLYCCCTGDGCNSAFSRLSSFSTMFVLIFTIFFK
uniref:Uncharacterized protein n=1 Tax=Panagrolaimus sp. JU765 TaxID=591449 RepID=A0AC34R261_9BILA